MGTDHSVPSADRAALADVLADALLGVLLGEMPAPVPGRRPSAAPPKKRSAPVSPGPSSQPLP